MNRLLQFGIIGIALILCVGCKGKRTAAAGASSSVRMEYAGQITVDSCEHYVWVKVRNPWDTAKILHSYVLVARDSCLPASLPEGTVVRTPLSKALVYSSVHCSLLMELGALHRIGGVCDLQYINIPAIRERCASGQMTDAGNSVNPDIERIIEMRPDAILLSPFENNGGYGRIEKLGIPIIECADYMESSPLGRAEWMRFFGLLFGQEAKADSLFSEVKGKYARLCSRVKTETTRPSLIAELKSGSAWYVPGGKSTMGQLYHDAGADYVWRDDVHSGSVPLAFEVVFDKGQDAAFWLIKYNQPQDKTLRELKADYEAYAGFGAFRSQHVYGCNTASVPFYEETPFHPEWLLEDLIGIFHPGILENHRPRYFKQLAE